jgi:extracellular factor (EF) 3-hydroxypalmitic acid methyl ester biosynthesis protein
MVNIVEPKKMPKNADRRAARRFSVSLELKIFKGVSAKPLFNSVIENMSQTGLCFALNSSLRCGKRYHINISSPSNRPVKTEIDMLSIVRIGSSYIHRARFLHPETQLAINEILQSSREVSKLNDRRLLIDAPITQNQERRLKNQASSISPTLLDTGIIKSRLAELVREFVQLSFLNSSPNSTFFNRVASSMHHMCAMIGECELTGISREEILELVKDAREIHGRSPFVSRLQKWPRGYQGDFETIDYLMNQQNFAAKNTIEYFIEQYALGSPVAQQHRNKVYHQSECILRAIRNAKNGEAKILVIACGSSPDLRRIVPQIVGSRFHVVLNDIDSGALNASKIALQAIENRCTMVRGNALSNLMKINSFGPYDLVVAGGLFDYLATRYIHILLKKIYTKSLKPDGRIVFTNIAAGNPFRLWLEYLVDWFLIERTEDDISRLLSDLYISPENVHITRDPSSLSIITEIVKTC